MSLLDIAYAAQVQGSDPAAPGQLRPAQEPCPHCSCCTAPLCESGRHNIGECMQLTSSAMAVLVAGCPCSAPTTRGTHAWRSMMISITRHATEEPMPKTAEDILRALTFAEAFTDPDGALDMMRRRSYVTGDRDAPKITEFGLRYLTARTENRIPTRITVDSVDVKKRTARVYIESWSPDAPVTVLIHQLTHASGLAPEDLPHRRLDARVNCQAVEADDLVLTRIMLTSPAVWPEVTPW